MADITICAGSECTKREECYRFKATPSMWQTYSAEFRQDENGDCDYFIPLKRKKIIKK